MKNTRLFQILATALLAAVYVAARLRDLTASCLWFDEIFSVHAAEHTWNTILSFVAKDLIHPPLFYIFLKLWISIGGESLVWLRLLPLLFAVVAVVPFLLLCRELRANAWTRTVAFLLFAVNGSLIKYAQEVRMYSLLLCLSLFSTWLFVKYFHKGKSLRILIIVNVLLVYSHYFGWFVVLGEVAAIMIFQRIKIRAILITFGVSALAFAPWAVAVLIEANSGSQLGQNIGWMIRPGVTQVLQLVFGLFEPFYFPASSADPITILKIWVPMIMTIAAGLVIGFINDREIPREKFETKRLLAILIALPVLAAFVLSWILPYSIWGTRHLIIVFVPAALLVASVIGRINSAAVKSMIAAVLCVISAAAFALQMQRATPNYIWCAWEPMAAQIDGTGDANVYVFEDLIAYHFWFGFHESGRPAKVVKIRNVAGAYFLPRGFNEVGSVELSDVKDDTFWIAYRGEQIDETANPLQLFISRGYHIADRKMIATDSGNAIMILLEK
jgi:uncharacterized membrane protein